MDTRQTALLFVVAGIAVLLFALWTTDEGVSHKNSWAGQKDQNSSPFSDEFRTKVNENLTRSFIKQQTEKLKMELENMKTAPPIRDGEVVGSADLSSHKLVLDRDDYYTRLDDLAQAEKQKELNHSIEAELLRAINSKRIRKEEEELFKAQYARSFIENAKKSGYNVILDDQYRILKYEKIKKSKDYPSLFNKSSDRVK